MLIYLKTYLGVTKKVIDTFSSLIWHKKYQECGDFELYMPVGLFTEDETSFIFTHMNSQEVLITRNDDDMIGKVEKVNISQDADGIDMITISGRDLSHDLARRIHMEHFGYVGTPLNVMKAFINYNCINPTASERKLFSGRNFAVDLGSYGNSGTSAARFFYGKDMYEVTQTLCKETGKGFKMLTSDNFVTFTLQVYSGSNQPIINHVSFSEENANLLESTYEINNENKANVAFIAGEGEGTARKTSLTTNESSMPSGTHRTEIFIDSRNTSSTVEDSDGNQKAISDDEYTAALNAEASATLISDYSGTETYDCSIVNAGQFLYGTDYNLGDIVNVDTYAGVRRAKVVGVTESYDENGHTVLPEIELI